MLPGTRLTFILRYKGRYDGYNDSNPFKLKVEGAHTVLVNGQPAQTQGAVKQKSFMADDEWEEYAEWHYASVSITAGPQATTLVPITLTLIPEDTDEARTYGGFVDLLPVDISAVFGITPTSKAIGGSLSQDLLEDYLESIKQAHLQDSGLWLVDGMDAEQNERLYVVEVSNNEDKLLEALQTDKRKVIFEGHANFGIGPNFSFGTHKTLASFTNFTSRAYTDIPITYRGDGTETDVLDNFLNGPEPEDLEAGRAAGRMREQGWSYIILQGGEVMGDALNYNIPDIGGLRFANDQQVWDGDEFEKHGQGFNNEWHFEWGGSRRLMVSSPAAAVPKNLRYESLFLNTCSSGQHFSENFHQGHLVYTNQTCKVSEATTRFVRGLIEGDQLSTIVADMNADELGGDEEAGVIGDAYKLHDFEE